MPRRPKPAWAPIPRREWRTGSLSRDRTSGTIRARLPKELDPKRSSRKFRPDDLAGATAWLDGEVARLRRGDAHSGETRLVDWCDHWCATAVEPFGVHNTTRAYDQALRKLAPIWDRPLEEVRTSDLQACVAGMAGLSAKTIRDTVAVWRRCFDRAVDDGLVARNPVRRLTLPRTEQPAEPRAVWTAEETARLWVAIVGHRFGAVYALVLGCGIRLGEALGLHWDDVDLDGRRAYVRRQWTECRWREAPKGKNPHWIALPAPVALALARHRATWPAVACGHTAHKHPEDGAPLVAGNPATGRPWSGAVVRRELAELATAHGIPVRSPHAGRHGVATALLADGVAPAVVASILGHANSATTLSVYDHATAEGADRARELMERRLDAPLGNHILDVHSGSPEPTEQPAARNPFDRRVVACNYAVSTSPVAQGALCYVSDVAYHGSEIARVHILARSRSGRWIYKWENIRRLCNFRLKTIPPEHPRYRDMRICLTNPEPLLHQLPPLGTILGTGE